MLAGVSDKKETTIRLGADVRQAMRPVVRAATATIRGCRVGDVYAAASMALLALDERQRRALIEAVVRRPVGLSAADFVDYARGSVAGLDSQSS